MNVKERIKEHEGLRLKPYRCTAGKITIGYGRNIEDKGITEAEASFLLDNDLNECHRECIKSFGWYGEIGDARQGVILEMCFNLGMPKLKKFRNMLTACEIKNYDLASREMLSSLWARQVGKRALTLAEIMKKGIEK